MDDKVKILENKVNNFEETISLITEQQLSISEAFSTITQNMISSNLLNEKFEQDIIALRDNSEILSNLIQDLSGSILNYSKIYQEIFDKYNSMLVSLEERILILEK